MAVVKRIESRTVWVVGRMVPGGSWTPAAEHAPGAREVTMRLTIESDGFGFLLLQEAHDGSVFADHWCESLAEAEAAASKWYGVHPEDWVRTDAP